MPLDEQTYYTEIASLKARIEELEKTIEKWFGKKSEEDDSVVEEVHHDIVSTMDKHDPDKPPF